MQLNFSKTLTSASNLLRGLCFHEPRGIQKLLCILIISLFNLLVTSSFSQDTLWKKSMTDRLNKMADSLSQNLNPWTVPNRVFMVEQFGAVGDSLTVNTIAIQNAIDSCSKKGGGVVLFSKGQYVTGTIILKSGVMLEVTSNAKILGSTNIADYPEKITEYKTFRQSMIYAEKCTNVGIRGNGEIYFRGELVNFPGVETIGQIVGRPYGIKMVGCINVVLQNIFLHNSAAWMQSYTTCQNMIFDGIKVINQANYNNDGLDPDGCTNVIIRNCYINAEDDAMCLKGASGKPSNNFLIENSTFLSSCNALKTGTETQGDFFNIVARNLKLGGISNNLYALKRHDATSGITLATVDGGNVHDILISNVTIDSARCPIFIRIGSRLRPLYNTPPKEVGYLKNVIIQGVSGNFNYKECSLILGIKDHPITDVIIDNYKIKVEGGGTSTMIDKEIPENDTSYPDARFFIPQGVPSYGFYVRYANNINISNAQIVPIKTDARPVIIVDDGTTGIFYNGNSITQNGKLNISLLKLAGSIYMKMDSTSVAFGTLFSNSVGIEDATKKNNATDNLSISEGSNSLSIDRRKPATVSDVLDIKLGQLSGTDYKFIIDATILRANDVVPFLMDNYNKTSTQIAGMDTVSFTADAKVAATFQNRFSIVFKPSTLSVNSIVVTANLISNVASIKWNTFGENAIAYYTIEKSTDGANYISIGQQVAQNTSNAVYTFTDKAMVTTTFYRLRVVNSDGTSTYSNTAKLSAHQLPIINIYPNPLTSRTMKISFTNVSAGNFTVDINNLLGKRVQEVVFSHSGGNCSHTITIKGPISEGIYNVIIRDAGGQAIYQTNLYARP